MRRHLTVLVAATLLGAVAAPAAGMAPTPEPVTVVGPFQLGTPEGDALAAELAVFTAQQGVPIIYETYGPVEDLFDLVTGPEPPDLILSPQPGTIRELAPHLVDLSGFVNPNIMNRDFGEYLIDLASVDGVVAGAPIKVDLKSLVWYRPAVFEAEGYDVPQSFDELVALSDQMVANGQVPWCNWIESGPATGWMGTDWVEDLLLGAEGPVVYDEWVDHTVVFQDPRVRVAFERFQFMIDAAGYVFQRSLMTLWPFFENVFPLAFGDCLMHKQASFFAAFIQGFGFDLGEFSTFKFPSVNQEFGDSVLGGGVYVAALNEREEVRLLVRYMLSQRFGREALAEVGGWLLPNVRFDTKRYTDELTRSFAEIVQAALLAGQYRFDGSDLMPPEVGAGTFWQGIVDLVDAAKTLPEVLEDIDDSWPS